jgi:hypothetical protein
MAAVPTPEVLVAFLTAQSVTPFIPTEHKLFIAEKKRKTQL